jgi:hypothetical protein
MVVMTIVRTAYRYNRPPGKRKPVALEVPAVVKAADPAKVHQHAVATPQRPGEPVPDDRLPAIVTIRGRKQAAIPACLFLWRKLVRRIDEET